MDGRKSVNLNCKRLYLLKTEKMFGGEEEEKLTDIKSSIYWDKKSIYNDLLVRKFKILNQYSNFVVSEYHGISRLSIYVDYTYRKRDSITSAITLECDFTNHLDDIFQITHTTTTKGLIQENTMTCRYSPILDGRLWLRFFLQKEEKEYKVELGGISQSRETEDTTNEIFAHNILTARALVQSSSSTNCLPIVLIDIVFDYCRTDISDRCYPRIFSVK